MQGGGGKIAHENVKIIKWPKKDCFVYLSVVDVVCKLRQNSLLNFRFLVVSHEGIESLEQYLNLNIFRTQCYNPLIFQTQII